MSADSGRPRVSARISPETEAAVEALRAEYRDADGALGSRSEVVRAILHDGASLMDATLRARVRQLSPAGEGLSAAWRRVIVAGLAALENE
jgi:hypothetical protein